MHSKNNVWNQSQRPAPKGAHPATREAHPSPRGALPSPERTPTREALAEVLERSGLLDELLNLLLDGERKIRVEVTSGELGFDAAVYG